MPADTLLSHVREHLQWLALKSRGVEWLHHLVPPLAKRLPSLMRAADKAGDHKAAVRIARLILAEKPESQSALQIIEKSMIKAGRYKAMLAFYESGYRAHPQSTALCSKALKFAKQTGDHRQIVLWSRRALDSDANFPGAVQALGQYYCQDGDYDNLATLLRDFEPQDSIKPYTAFKIAFLMLRVRNHSGATHLLRTARKKHPGDFRLLASLIACETAGGNLDEAVRLGMELTTREDGTHRAYFFYQQLVAAIEHSDQGLAKYEWEAMVFRSRMRDILSLLPPLAYPDWLQQNRDHVAAIRSTPKSIGLFRDQPTHVSYICPIHRHEDIENAIAQISRQSWRNAEAVFAINGAITSGEEITRLWHSDIALKIVACNDLDRIGPILNRAIQHSCGDIIIRIDADNIYMRDYATDSVMSIEHFNADLVGHKNGCRLFKGDGLVAGPPDSVGFHRAAFGDEMGGASLSFRRGLFEQVQFSEELRRGEDTTFVKQCIADEFRVYIAGPLNFLSVRSDDSSSHTWDVSKAEILLLNAKHILGSKADIERDLTYSLEAWA